MPEIAEREAKNERGADAGGGGLRKRETESKIERDEKKDEYMSLHRTCWRKQFDEEVGVRRVMRLESKTYTRVQGWGSMNVDEVVEEQRQDESEDEGRGCGIPWVYTLRPDGSGILTLSRHGVLA